MSPVRVLIAEDDLAVRTLLVAVLEGEGYPVLAVENGRAALAALPAWQPNLIVLDLAMPFLDGVNLWDLLRQDAAWARIPVVVLTAYPERADRSRLEPAVVIAKPFDLDQLLCEIE